VLQEREALGDAAPPKLVPKTLDSMREYDETTIAGEGDKAPTEEDAEVRYWHLLKRRTFLLLSTCELYNVPSDFCRFLLCTCGWERRGERRVERRVERRRERRVERRGERGAWSGGARGRGRMYTVWVLLTVNCTHGYS
jgi:hypothetical protein